MGECLISRRGGEAYKLPILNPSYPQDITAKASATGTVSFSVAISEDGKPAEYTYQWYVNGSAVSGATGKSYVRNVSAVGVFTVYCTVTNKAGSVSSREAVLNVVTPIPVASNIYNGSCELKKENEYDWCLYCYGSGNFTYPESANLEVCIVAGGAGGSYHNTPGMGNGANGGGGGTVVQSQAVTVNAGQPYSVVIGGGGPVGHGVTTTGGSSSAFGFSAAGGVQGAGGAGGANGSNGGKGADGKYAFNSSYYGYYGGFGGGGSGRGASPGEGGAGGGGRGATAADYSGACTHAVAGTTNKGGGGGGMGGGYDHGEHDNTFYGGNGAVGGSGIVLIRNAR